MCVFVCFMCVCAFVCVCVYISVHTCLSVWVHEHLYDYVIEGRSQCSVLSLTIYYLVISFKCNFFSVDSLGISHHAPRSFHTCSLSRSVPPKRKLKELIKNKTKQASKQTNKQTHFALQSLLPLPHLFPVSCH